MKSIIIIENEMKERVWTKVTWRILEEYCNDRKGDEGTGMDLRSVGSIVVVLPLVSLV